MCASESRSGTDADVVLEVVALASSESDMLVQMMLLLLFYLAMILLLLESLSVFLSLLPLKE